MKLLPTLLSLWTISVSSAQLSASSVAVGASANEEFDHHRRNNELVFYPPCNVCSGDASYLPDENVDVDMLSIPSLGFFLTCGGAYLGGNAGLLSPELCNSVMSITATGLCGCTISQFALSFVNKTFVEGLTNEHSNGPQLVELDEGRIYEVVANVTTRASGIVSLADAAGKSIESVSCGPRDSNQTFVTIQFNESISVNDLKAMFPLESLLVINKDYFGVCFPNAFSDEEFSGEDDFDFDQDLYKSATDAGDGYVVIQTRELLSSTTARIDGEIGYFFSMFEDGHVTAQLIEAPQARRKLVTFKIGANDLLPIPFLTMKVVGTASFNTDITVIDSDFGWWGFDFTIRVEKEFILNAKVETSLTAGVPTPIRTEKALISVPIGPSPVAITQLVKKIGIGEALRLNLPDLKIGAYLELPLVFELTQASLVREFGPFVDYTYSSGKKVTEIDMWFKPASFSVGVSPTVISSVPETSTFDGGVKSLQERGTVNVDFFVGFRPRFMIYLSEYIGAGVGIDFGGELASKYSRESAFSMVTNQVGVAQVGPCDSCHELEIELGEVVRSPTFEAFVKLPVKILGWRPSLYKLSIPLLPGGLTIKAKVLTICDWESGPDVQICGSASLCCDTGDRGGICFSDRNKCCYSSSDECCTDAGCDGNQLCEAEQCVPPCGDSGRDCFGICIPRNECCPIVEKKCEDACISSDECCPFSEYDCDGVCRSIGDCCPSFEKSCEGECIALEEDCCGSNFIECFGRCIPQNSICCNNTQRSCDGACIPAEECCLASGEKECDGECIRKDLCCPISEQDCGDDGCFPKDECCPGYSCCIDPCCGSACDHGGCAGDPHMITYDFLRYSCQGKGDFVLTKTLSGFEIDVRFKQVGSRFVSLTTGFATRISENSTLVEIIIGDDQAKTVRVLINGTAFLPNEGYYEDRNVIVARRADSFVVFLRAEGISVHASIRLPQGFKHFDLRTTVPKVFSQKNSFLGLLGSPDGNPNNDWKTPDGSFFTIPETSASLSTGREAHEFCVDHWCIESEQGSLFTYSVDSPFNSSGCKESFPAVTYDISNVAQEIQGLCGTNIACLVDGNELGVEGALNILQSESAVKTSSFLQVLPQSIVSGSSVNLIITIDLSDVFPEGNVESVDIEAFAVFRVDPITRNLISSNMAILLEDKGSGIGNDTDTADGIFSNMLFLRSDFAGEDFGFLAVPVVDEAPQFSSPFQQLNLFAVRSYSAQSGIGDKFDVATPIPSQSPTEKPLLLYENDFENPFIPVLVDCGSNLHINDEIDKLYGTDQFTFRQQNSIETVVINTMWSSTTPYHDPKKIGGNYAIGMYGTILRDLLALDFDTQGKLFLNAELDLSTIDVDGCRVPPFTGADAILRLTLLDAPDAANVFAGDLLDVVEVTSPAAANAWTYDWTRVAVALNATAAMNGQVALVFEMLSPVYAVFDNLVIEASDTPKLVPYRTTVPATVEPTAAPISSAPSQLPTNPGGFDFSEGFPCDDFADFFTVNSNIPSDIYPEFREISSDKCFLRMTPDVAAQRATSAFVSHTFSEGNSNFEFSMTIAYRIFGPLAGSADGMAFVMHQDPQGVNALGGPGGSLGIYRSKQVKTALVVEWDTYPNPGAPFFDNGENNAHLMMIDSMGEVMELNETSGLNIRTGNSGETVGRMWVDFCSDMTLRAYINSTGSLKPLVPQVSAQIDLNVFFTGRNVTIGYTSGTWGQGDNHDILSWKFEEVCPVFS